MIGLLKRLLPQPVKQRMIKMRKSLRYGFIWMFSRSRFLSSVYYCFFSNKFDREHQAVLLGRVAFLKREGLIHDSNTLLRRNIHRIEKGLIMQPRRNVFALDYIAETLKAFIVACDNAEHDPQELKWAADVLGEYFAAVDLSQFNPALKPAYLGKAAELDSDGKSVPYTFDAKIQAGISSEQFHQLCVQRRSVRWFDERPVSRELLEQAVNMASLAPSACNRQPYRFFIADDKSLSKQLVSIPGGTKGFAQNVPCTIVVAADLANYPGEKDRHLVYIDSALAAMQLMLAFETLGLSSCPINFPDIELTEQKMAQALNLDMTIRPVMLIAVGYGQAKGKIPFSQKKSAQQLIDYVTSTQDNG